MYFDNWKIVQRGQLTELSPVILITLVLTGLNLTIKHMTESAMHRVSYAFQDACDNMRVTQHVQRQWRR